ncbi:hypothetical protein SKAU_G00303170 [Synaphobranchus kaupii]|uniref:Uncharacterized protein n=1 Tax=Synaphobranchus kaupii TaxID=118154 RepID=A0A9Q1IN83_SYNKA|nr:hypothetical protein SKAU_G00303170 [Synaphobranchus kaupii]
MLCSRVLARAAVNTINIFSLAGVEAASAQSGPQSGDICTPASAAIRFRSSAIYYLCHGAVEVLALTRGGQRSHLRAGPPSQRGGRREVWGGVRLGPDFGRQHYPPITPG